MTSPSPSRLRTPTRDVSGYVATAAFGAVLATVAVLRVHNRWPVAFDISVFDQGLWKLANGKGAYVTTVGDNLFADHLSPVLALFVPLYKVAPTAAVLVVIQAFVVAVTVLPMRALAGDLGLPRWVGTAAVATSAPLLAAALFDFHPTTLAAPAIAWAVLAVKRDDPRTLTWAALLIALARADLVWVLVGIAVVATPRCRRRIAIVVPPILAIAILTPVLWSERQGFGRVYATLGTGPIDALTHPARILTTLVSQPALKTLAIWLLPIGFLIVLRWRWLLAVVIAGLPFLLSSIPGISEPWFYYGAVFTPIVLAGAMEVVAEDTSDRLRWLHSAVWIVGALVAIVLASPLSPNAPASLSVAHVVRPHEIAGYDEALRQIGPDERVAADFDLLAPLAHRDQAYVLPCPFEDVPNEEFCTKAVAARTPVDVVLAHAGKRELLERQGLRVQELPGGELILGRP